MKSLILILALSISTISSGCAKPKHTAVVVDSSLFEILNDTFAAEQALLRTGDPRWTTERSQEFNKKLLPAVDAGRQFNTILSNWKSGDPIPAQLHDAIDGITAALKQISTDLPPGTTRDKIISNLATAESIILNALNLVLTLKG
jgi:hypothetical protein